MIKIGAKVKIISGDLYLGRKLPTGTEGKVIGVKYDFWDLANYFYRVEIGGRLYALAPTEIAAVDEKAKV